MSLRPWTCPDCGLECRYTGVERRPDAPPESTDYAVSWKCPGCHRTRWAAEFLLEIPDDLPPEPVAAARDLFRRGLHRRGLALLNRVLEGDPADREGWGLKGGFLVHLGLFDAYVEMLRQAVARGAPADLLIDGGVSLQDMEAHAAAARAYQLYREADPDGAWVGVAWSNEATVLRKLGDDAKAEEYYRKAVAADAGRLTNHVNLAALLLHRQRWAEAAAAAEKGLTVEGEPHLRQSLYEIVATARLELRQGQPALKAAQAVLDVNPWRGHAHYLYGRALMLLNRPEEAMAALQQALALEPDNADAAWLLRMVTSAAVNGGTAVPG